MQDLEKCIDHTLRQYNNNDLIIKRKGDKDKILACKTIRELLKLRRKLGLVEWSNQDIIPPKDKKGKERRKSKDK